RNLGLVFQDQKLLYDRSVFDNVMLPLSFGELGPREAARRARAALDKVGLADEPTANLDADSAARVLEIFAAFNQVGVTVLVSTHDEALIGRFARRVLRLAQGSVAA